MIPFAKTTLQAVLLGSLLGSASAQAGTIHYQLDGVTDAAPGVLPNQTYTGNFSFDDAGLSGIGNEQLSLLSLSFSFLGQSFTLADGEVPPHAEFVDGIFTGLNYIVTSFDPAFVLVGGATDTSDAYFAYSPSAGTAGYGSLNYSLVSVPEPMSLALFGLGLGVLRISRRQSKSA